MPLGISATDSDTYRVYYLTGETTVDSLYQLADTICADQQEKPKPYGILDCQQMYAALELGDLYNVGIYFSSRVPPSIRLLAINTPNEWQQNDFSEDVMSNHGSFLRHFDDLETAEAWIHKQLF